MQTVYAIETQELFTPAANGEKDKAIPLTSEKRTEKAIELLQDHFDKSLHLLVYLVHTLTRIAQFATTYAHQKASKHLPSQEDLAVNTKIAENELIGKIMDLPSWKDAIKHCQPERITDQEIIRKLFLEFKDKEPYDIYISDPSRTYQNEKAIIECLFKEFLLVNDFFITHVSELFPNWEDDADMMVLLVMNFLQKLQGYEFKELISKEKKQFGFSLLQTTLEKKELALEYIRPRLKNWDPERIANLDMILMRMGVCEFLFFETIPPKVTINEYIDIAKEYSTQQSGHFVNGILDNIHKDLVKENKLHKIAYKP
jgi:N utilization substance protein B